MRIVDTSREPLKWSLEFVGRGVGASKTTTVRDGAVLAEEFGIGDEIGVHWIIPDYVDRYQDVTVKVHAYINAAESGKLASMQMQVGSSNGAPVNVVLGTETDVDRAVSDVAFVDFHFDFTLDAATYMPTKTEDAIQLIITRIASSNDPTADVRVHLVELEARA